MDSIEVSDVASLLNATKSVWGGKPRGKWYRGQTSADWTLMPAIHRTYSSKDEVNMTTHFRLAAPTRYAHCPDAGDFARWLSLMQHFGLPTRLLDWTESPLIAAFFAVSYEPRDGDAVIWSLSPGELNETSLGNRGLKLLPHVSVNPLLQPAFTGGESPEQALAVRGQEVDFRMTVQQGGFTIHGAAVPLEEHPKANAFLRKMLIPSKHRKNFQKELWLLGVRRSMLFPDIANLARELSERPAQRQAWDDDEAAEQIVGREPR